MGHWKSFSRRKLKVVVARNKWYCAECSKLILKGEEHYKMQGVTTGYGDGIRFHKNCKPPELEVIE